ncbi:hypothetical protein [Gordonia westfalica]|uniref:Uncharacterized protein n=1 Tax=Gordonia westfalica TaxID=158898 RepID=A0A1H2LG85_9ACTN|nr:hypothetical protein [Gordonia westfalica]SDU79834.1 hypothetical protein SAMN04488548_136280 [Gordonia westfalica]
MSARAIVSIGRTSIEVVATALVLMAGIIVLVVAELVGWLFRP